MHTDDSVDKYHDEEQKCKRADRRQYLEDGQEERPNFFQARGEQNAETAQYGAHDEELAEVPFLVEHAETFKENGQKHEEKVENLPLHLEVQPAHCDYLDNDLDAHE